MKKRMHVYYEGSVQGVGFRFTAERIAVELGLTGWVKNLPDGRVELVAEGEEGLLSELLLRIRGNMGGYISGDTVKKDAYTGEYADFGIRF